MRDLQAQRLNIVFSSELPAGQVLSANRDRRRPEAARQCSGTRPDVRSAPADRAGRPERRPGLRPRQGRTTGRSTGTVVDARTEPFPESSSRARSAARTTDDGSCLRVADLPTGPLPLYVSLVGYGLARPTVDVRANETADVTIPLADGTGTYTEAVTVVGDAFRGSASEVPVQFALTSSEVSDLRGVLTDDPFGPSRRDRGSTGNDFRSEFAISAAIAP